MPKSACNKSAYTVLPVVKALRVLELVAERGHDVTLTFVCDQLKLPKTTTFRYLQTLAEIGFLHHDRATDRYAIGAHFRRIAKTDNSFHFLRQVARPAMLDLLAEFNETVNLAVEVDGVVVYIDIIESRRPLRFQARIGDRHPLHSTALGKAILSALPEADRRLRLARPLAEMASRTLVEKRTLEHQLRQIVKRGYATETEENEDGAYCIGAAITDDSGYPIAAISLSAPLQRMLPETAKKAGQRIVAIVRQISAQCYPEGTGSR